MVPARSKQVQRQHAKIVMAQLTVYQNCSADNAADCADKQLLKHFFADQ